ncbi:MAG TPA: ribonuclease P protein component [Polyangiales bacterium]
MVPGALGSARGRRLLRLLPTDRLRKRFEFGRVRDQGRRVYTKSFVILLRPNSEGGQRLGLTVSQKVGGAVRRNRVKRLLREVFRSERTLFPARNDIVVIAKSGCGVDSLAEVRAEIAQAGSALHSAAQQAARRSVAPAAQDVKGVPRPTPRTHATPPRRPKPQGGERT